jgi:SAM-dependent methyltransferase
MKYSLRRFIKKLLRSPAERRHVLVGPAHLWKMKREFQIGFLKKFGLKPEHYLLDIGCGTLRGGIPLIGYLENGRYFGVESRSEVLDEGRKELGEAGLDNKHPVLIEAEDISQVRVGQEFDYVWAFSVLIHMTDEIVNDCLKLVGGCLKPEGVFFANVNIGDAPDGNWQGFPVTHRSMEFYESLCARHGLAAKDIGEVSELGHVTGDPTQDTLRMLEIRKA